MTVTLWHNPRCSKSRASLALLEEKGIETDIRLYRDVPPSEAEIRDVLTKMNIGPRDLIRKGEAIYKDLGLGGADITDDALIAAMAAHPILIERPVAIGPNGVSLGRPPEQVLDVV